MTTEQITFIIAHWNIDMKGADIAAAIGVDYQYLRKRVSELRAKGYEITRNTVPPGTVSEWRQGPKGMTTRVKGEDGKWQYVKSEGRQFKKYGPDLRRGRERKAPQKTIKTTQPMPRRNNPRKIAAPKEGPIKPTALTTLQKLEQGYQWVQIDSKTKVLRHPSKITA